MQFVSQPFKLCYVLHLHTRLSNCRFFYMLLKLATFRKQPNKGKYVILLCNGESMCPRRVNPLLLINFYSIPVVFNLCSIFFQYPIYSTTFSISYIFVWLMFTNKNRVNLTKEWYNVGWRTPWPGWVGPKLYYTFCCSFRSEIKVNISEKERKKLLWTHS